MKVFSKVHEEIGKRMEKRLKKVGEGGPDHVKAPYGLTEPYGGDY